MSEVILGLGIDLIEVARFEREVSRHGDGLIAALFSPTEIGLCRSARRPFPAYAIRFAVKEALLKALGTGLVGRMSWHDIEVLAGGGEGSLRVTGATKEAADRLGAGRVHVTTALTRDVAAASVVIEGRTS